MKRHLLIISFDALGSEDFEFIKTLPNFSNYLETAAYCKNVKSVYPSLTYPAHTSIVTGRYPNNHGVINNTLLQPKRKNPDWYWQRKYIRGTTLYDEAVKKGLEVAALLWPVTGGANIHYNMPEILANRPWQTQLMVSLLNGTPSYQYVLNKKFGHLRKGISQPYLDDFTHQSVLYTIKNKAPHLLLAHYTDLDTMRHRYGVKSDEAKAALRRLDQRLGEIIHLLKAQQIYEESTLVLLGDHSQLDEHKVMYLNTVFHKNNWIQVNKKGVIVDWQVLLKNCDGSAYIYIKEDQRKDLYDPVLKQLKLLMTTTEGIEEIFTSEQAKEKGADSTCAFMLEAQKGYYFLDDIKTHHVKEIKGEELGHVEHMTAATHGYLPTKDHYATVFMAAGQGIKPNVEVEAMDLVDEGPTLGKLLGITLEDADGKVIEDFLDEVSLHS